VEAEVDNKPYLGEINVISESMLATQRSYSTVHTIEEK
jgi:hypothetical protein